MLSVKLFALLMKKKTIRVQVVEGFGRGNAYTVYADDFEPVYKKAVIV